MERVFKFKTLLGQKNLDFSIECLRSFLENSIDKIELQIFEDGTLTTADHTKLVSSLKNTTVIMKNEREDTIYRILSNYPYCQMYRTSSPYAQKLFDVMLYNDSNLFFIDSDIYFLCKFKLPEFGNIPAFILDKQNAYAFTPSQFLTIHDPIFPRVNSGLFYFPRRYFSLDLLERLLSEGLWKKKGIISWLEQTLWAFLAGQSDRIGYFDDSQIMMARQNLSVDDKTIAVHLVSSYRFHFQFLKSLTRNNPENGIQNIKLVSTRNFLNKYEFVADRLKKRIYRNMGISQ